MNGEGEEKREIGVGGEGNVQGRGAEEQGQVQVRQEGRGED